MSDSLYFSIKWVVDSSIITNDSILNKLKGFVSSFSKFLIFIISSILSWWFVSDVSTSALSYF